MCEYNYYRDDESIPKLYCSIDESRCHYSRMCEKLNKFVSLENQKECFKYNMEKQKNVPEGSYFVQTVRPSKKGGLYLYVIMGEKIERVHTKEKELNQDYVYLKEGIDGYDVSLKPFETKRNYTRKKVNGEERS